MCNDTWTYFTGYGSSVDGKKLCTSTDIGSRYQDLQWKYRSLKRTPRTTSLDHEFTGPFWNKERSLWEQHRRSGGLEGYGGDSLYAGMELVRFAKLALWKDKLSHMRKELKKNVSKQFVTSKSVENYLGPNHRPVAADWAVPLFSNAVTAFLEIGYITNKKDFRILRNKLDIIADGIAVGIFSLVNGLKIMKLKEFNDLPKAKAVNWKAYKIKDRGSFFQEVLPTS
jgi:hypothetical protein